MKRTSHSSPVRRRLVADEGGFTLVEVLVVALILVTGMFGAFLLLDTGAQATNNSSQRDGANAVAEELVERAAGMRYDATYNDLTDRRPTSPASGILSGTPAERFRAAMAPDAPATPITDSDPSRPWVSVSSWDLVRGNTTYRVSYKACTDSDTIDGFRVEGPFDCSRIGSLPPCDPLTDPSCQETEPPTCKSEFLPQDPSAPLEVRLQLLGAIGLQTCLLSSASPLAPLTTSLCSLLANTATGTLADLLGDLAGGSGLLSSLGLAKTDIGLCPGALEKDLTAVQPGIASTTRIEVGVSWTERSTNKPRTIRQQTVVRRPA